MASKTETITISDIELLKDQRKKDKYLSAELDIIKETIEKIKKIGELICNGTDLSFSLARNIPFNRQTHVHSIWIKIWYNDYSYCKDRVFYTLGLFKPDEEDKQTVASQSPDDYIISDYILLLSMDYKYNGSYQPSDKVLDIRKKYKRKLNITKTLEEIAADAQTLIKDWKDAFAEYADAADNGVIIP